MVGSSITGDIAIDDFFFAGGSCPYGKYFDQRRKKDFFKTMDKKSVFVTKYFILALKLFTVVFKRSDRSISSDDT